MDKQKSIISSNIIDDERSNQMFNSSKTTEDINSVEYAGALLNFEHLNVGPSQPRYVRTVQNFLLIWVDGSIDEINSENYLKTIDKLQQVVNTVNTFTDIDECIDFITDIKEEKVFIISSSALGPTTAAVVHDITQVSAVYIFGEDQMQQEQWTEQWPKLKGVFTDITSICEKIKQTAEECDQNSVSMSFIASSTDGSNQNLDQLDQSFMYTQIMKEIILTIDFKSNHLIEYTTYCRELVSSTIGLGNIDNLEQQYRDHQPIWWYTYPGFLYSMLNRALRTMEVDLIIKMGFFVRDLHEQIAKLHLEQYADQHQLTSFTVYRGQGLSETDFDQLRKTQGGLMSFNNFLSTSFEQDVSLLLAESNTCNPDFIGILFKLTIDPTISSTPFANIRGASYFPEEKEILFSMHSIFRIGQIKQMNNNSRLWQVDLTLTGEKDPQLHILTEHIRKETFPDQKGWYRLGNLLIALGQFSKAEQVCNLLLNQTTDQSELANSYYMLGLIKGHQGEHTEAIAHYEMSLKIRQKTPKNHMISAISSNSIGVVYDDMGEHSKALSYYEKSLEILKESHPTNPFSFATSYNNIGGSYFNMGEYPKALSYFEKALEIFEKNLPTNHPDLATSYNNIGQVYVNMGEHSKALSYYDKALKIEQKSLPVNHPSFASSYNSMGLVYNNMGQYSEALSSHEKALEIRQKTLPVNHPDLATSYNNIGSVYETMGEYLKALSSHEKALELQQKCLPANHPDLATSYNNIGSVREQMGEYSKALSSHEKALEVRQKSLSANHPDLATSHNNIGSVYDKMGEYSKALSYYEKTLDIFEKRLPVDHPSLATSRNNIGLVHFQMNEYLKALSYFEQALKIRQKCLPQNHPDLATSYNSIGLVYSEMDEYLKALSSLGKALEIREKSLPVNHPSLATSYNNIGSVHDKMGEYAKALSYYKKSLKIYQETLPENHPSFATSYNNIGMVYFKVNEYPEALSYYKQAMEIFGKTLPANHPDFATSYNNIGPVYVKMGQYSRALSYYEKH